MWDRLFGRNKDESREATLLMLGIPRTTFHWQDAMTLVPAALSFLLLREARR